MVPRHRGIVMIHETRLVTVTAQTLAVVLLSQEPENEPFFYPMKKHRTQTLCRQKQPKIATI